MALPVCKTWLNYNHQDYHYNVDSISMTIPEMSYTVKDLVQKFTLGTIPADIVRNVLYTENPDFDDFIETEYGDFDLTDYAMEMNKLRELHSLRMERLKAVESNKKIEEVPTPKD